MRTYMPKYTMCQLELIFMSPHIYEFRITRVQIHMFVPGSLMTLVVL